MIRKMWSQTLMYSAVNKESAFLGKKQHLLGKGCNYTWYILHNILNEIGKFAFTRKNAKFVAKVANTGLTKILWPFLHSPKGYQLLPHCFACTLRKATIGGWKTC